MFWRFGGYANISTIDTILDKPDFTIEELLDESDLIQELKQHNSKLIEYLREPKVLQKLLEYVVAPKLEPIASSVDEAADEEVKEKKRLMPFSRPGASRSTDTIENEDDEQEKKRNRYAFVACEVLSSDTWSIYEALTENRDLVRTFWDFLSRPAPLDPLQASYFTKVNESLFEKKTEDMMELLRSLTDAVSNLLKHVECPMIMDLLLKIIALDRSEGGQGIVEWLHSKNIIPTLLSCLAPENSWVVQTAAGEFIKAIITISANASQNEQQCIGPNELTRQLVSKECVEQLVGYMLGGGNPLTVGVGIIIEVIRKNNSDYDPDVGTESNAVPSSRDPIYLGTLLRLFAENVPKFMSFIMDAPTQKNSLASTFGDKLQPLGFDRFKTCELMAELLHCSNMGLLNEIGSEQLIAARDRERTKLRIEEVEPSKEMSEDTSHEFVKAEDDMPPPPPLSSFLEKDEEEFVDEPLSSPRLTVGEDKVVEQKFDEPDLIVAPLSPTKPKASLPEQAEDSKVTDASKSMETEKTAEAATSDKLGAIEPITATEQAAAIDRGLSPHPEDKPAPLFAAPPAPESGADRPPQPEQAPATPAPTEDVPASQQSAEESVQGTTILHPPVEDAPKSRDPSVEPVVGDYLKMQFVEHRVVPTILSFFFSYPWNNFLHNVVYDIVQQVFNGPMDRGYNPTLAVSLFEAADVTAAIINGQKVSDESQAKTKTRMGYMGHLTLIAEEVVKFTERHPPELLSETVLDRVMSQEWINYVEGALAETRERDNAILGGVRPEVALGHRGSIGGGQGLGGVGLSGLGAAPSVTGSSALQDAGLNGGIELNENGGNGVGPFAISGGTLMSGFGSSSDEEDDDNDNDDDDVNSEFRSYTDSLNNPGASLAPPSIPPPPPPPPPLNIPPSRARLQLAARLAMHQKNNQAQSSGLDNNDDNDNGTDPFADADDDDVDDDDDESGNGRGAWWRGVVSRNEGVDSEDDDDEFGDFAMAEGDKSNDKDKVVLKPMAVNPTKENTRTLSGLWPFGSKNERSGQSQDNELGPKGDVLVVDEKNEDRGQHPIEVKEAKSRTSIEDPDDDDDEYGAEVMAGSRS